MLGKWRGLEGENRMQRWHQLFASKVMLGARHKDGVSCCQQLGSRYNYLGVSCSLMCDEQENLEGNWTEDMIILL